MLPATMTVSSVLASAATVVSQFDTLISFVIALAVGLFAVRFVISKAKSATR